MRERGVMRRCGISSVCLILLLVVLVSGSALFAQNEPVVALSDTTVIDSALVATPQIIPPAAVGLVSVEDTPDDAGKSITVSWGLSSDDAGGRQNVAKYIVLRGGSPAGPFDTAGTVTSGTSSLSDGQVENGIDYYYKVIALSSALLASGEEQFAGLHSESSGAAQASGQWFHQSRSMRILPWVLVIGISVLWFIKRAKKGHELYVRPIAGLAEVEQAVGRATEMGRKIIFVPGIADMDNVQTLAAVTILGRIAKLAAEYDAPLDVPVSRSLVMVTAREVVKEAYLNVGRPDAFHEDMVRYITDDQFGYAAALDGLFVREKPATIFYMGAFYAESLILAETGNAIGAIQIAGTAMPAQLPFFVAACDYTLIGEELFAASAYLSKEPKLLGSLKGQDVGKILILTLAVLGLIYAALGAVGLDLLPESWPGTIEHWFRV